MRRTLAALALALPLAGCGPTGPAPGDVYQSDDHVEFYLDEGAFRLARTKAAAGLPPMSQPQRVAAVADGKVMPMSAGEKLRVSRAVEGGALIVWVSRGFNTERIGYVLDGDLRRLRKE